MLRYLTAGESHGKGLTVIIDGVPSNIKIASSDIDYYLIERQKGFGRGGRQKIETDKAEIISGIRHGRTTGAPVSIFIKNKDFEHWKNLMAVEPVRKFEEINVPRPGHADFAGGARYNHKDFRNVLERASARETAARITAGAIAKKMLSLFDVNVFGYAVNIGGVETNIDGGIDISNIKKQIKSVQKKYKVDLRFPDILLAGSIKKKIQEAMASGDTVGGIIKVITSKIPAGLGDYTQWDKKLDSIIAKSLMSIQAIKGVEFGAGFSYADIKGSNVHDEIAYSKNNGFYRKTNNAGGIEGGMTNGERLIVRSVLKPISTVKKGLMSVNVKSKKKVKTIYERSDVCAVPAASLIAEASVAFDVANAFIEKFGNGDIDFILKNYKSYKSYLKKF